MPSSRCSHCGICFPAGEDYITWRSAKSFKDTCVVCLAPTSYSSSKPIPLNEAKSIAGHAEFFRRYDKREEMREKKGIPTQEQLGSLDANVEIKRIRAMRKAMREVSELPEAA